MNCEEADRFLDPYLDGELEAAQRTELEQHLAECQECRQKLEQLRQFRAFFTANAPHYPSPPGLKAKVLARLEAEKKSKIIALIRQPWLYAAALLVICFSLAWLLLVPNREKNLADQAVANFQRAALLERVCDVVSPDPGVVKPWFTGKLDFLPPVLLPGLNFQMRGGRLDVLENHKVAALTYKRDKDLVTVFVWPDAGKPLPDKSWTIGEKAVCAWHSGSYNFVAVSNMNDQKLDQVIQQFRIAMAK